jgi:hypothetical protein
MAVKAAGPFTLSGDMVCIVAGKADLEVGGTTLKAGSKLEVKASSMGAGGKALLKLKGTIDYKD